MSTADTPQMSGEERDKSPEELRHEIDETRERLGDTVEALAFKTDVKAQAKRRVESLRGTAKQVGEKAKATTPESANAGAQQVVGAAKQNPLPLAAAGAFVAGFLIGRRAK